MDAVRPRERLVHEHLVGPPGRHAHGLVVGDPAQPAVRLVRLPAAVAVPPGAEDRLLGGLVGGVGHPTTRSAWLKQKLRSSAQSQPVDETFCSGFRGHNRAMQALPTPAAEAYDGLAPYYDELTRDHDYEGWTRHLEETAARFGARGRNLLDAACGPGKSFLPFMERGYEVTACDISPEMVALARGKAPGAELFVADVRTLEPGGQLRPDHLPGRLRQLPRGGGRPGRRLRRLRGQPRRRAGCSCSTSTRCRPTGPRSPAT